MSTIRYIIFLTLIVFVSLPACKDSLGEDPYSNLSFPVLDKAYEVKTVWENDIFAKETTYSISYEIDPDAVFSLYDKFFQNAERNPDVVFQDGSVNDEGYLNDGDWRNPPARYIMGWLNVDKTIVLKVTVFYVSNNSVKVTCLLHPFVDQSEWLEFFSYAKAHGQIDELERILSKYKKENGNFDFDKAKKYERKTELFERLIKIIEADTKQLRSNYKKFAGSLDQKNGGL